MDYAKHFSGDSAAGTNAAHYYLNLDGTASSTSAASSSAIIKEQVIGEAIESTLKDCGLTNCKYYGIVDGKNISYLCLDDTKSGKPGFYIYFVANYTYFVYGYCTSTSDTYISHISALPTALAVIGGSRNTNSSYNVFSSAAITANQYDFYVRVAGDTASSFIVQLSKYGTTTFNPSLSLSISNMTDKRNDRKAYGYCFGAITFVKVYAVFKDTNVSVTGATAPVEMASVGNSNGYIMVDNYVVLVSLFIEYYPNMFFDGGYLRPNTFDADKFYEIDGDVYYVQTNGIFKCTTQL